MRVGIDACCWSNERGYGRFARELLRAMAPLAPGDEFVCFLDRWTRDRFFLELPNVSVVCVDQAASPSRAASARGFRSPSDMLRLSRAVHAEPLDVFFCPSVYTYFPLPLRLPAVITIHDAIAERYPKLTLPSARDRLFWRMKVRLAIWQARLVLTVSEFSRRELAAVLGIPPGIIRVAGEAPAPIYRPSETAEQVRAVARKVGVPDGARWFIYVGGFNPHKNVDSIVHAHGAAARRFRDTPLYLLLVGSADRDVFHGDLGTIEAAIAEEGTGDLVKWTGFVADEDLRHLHTGALALAIPSQCEGYGLPAVEAAACGTPVVATTASPLPEILEGGGLFVPPGDVGALSAAFGALLEDEPRRRSMGRRAREQTSRLSWSSSAEVTLQALREAAG
ncbi:MAG TPA: glycosyltransferase family 1 protein [Candidatus Polarisedimenticolia bacterium]|nr:glycosyltransferase family 1 protein [Candidatus Polarisedimenticolia bacterium]